MTKRERPQKTSRGCAVETLPSFRQRGAVKLFPLSLTLLLATLLGCKEAKQNVVAATTSAPPATASSLTPYLPHAQPRLQTIKLFVGNQEVVTELALKPVDIFTGMMWRTNMPEGEAMLFVFSEASPRGFYMRNTYVPLSLAYVDPEGIIQEIHDLQPLNENSVNSKSANIQYVLEVPQGWFQRHQIRPGTLIRTPHGDLKQTFSFRPLK
jgi:uncharacterized membrane protein (UPF0127 family)